jgi:hypothetical protein
MSSRGGVDGSRTMNLKSLQLGHGVHRLQSMNSNTHDAKVKKKPVKIAVKKLVSESELQIELALKLES